MAATGRETGTQFSQVRFTRAPRDRGLSSACSSPPGCRPSAVFSLDLAVTDIHRWTSTRFRRCLRANYSPFLRSLCAPKSKSTGRRSQADELLFIASYLSLRERPILDGELAARVTSCESCCWWRVNRIKRSFIFESFLDRAMPKAVRAATSVTILIRLEARCDQG